MSSVYSVLQLLTDFFVAIANRVISLFIEYCFARFTEFVHFFTDFGLQCYIFCHRVVFTEFSAALNSMDFALHSSIL